jgi:type I restriction enzyme, S subunit
MPEVTPGWMVGTLADFTRQEDERVGRRRSIVLSSTKHHGLVPSTEYFKNRQIFSDNTSNYRLVRRNWFAYATNHLSEGSIGLQARFDEACVSPIYTVFSCVETVDPDYLYRLLRSPRLINSYRLHEQASVDRRGAVRYGDFAKIEVLIPPLAEQRKIAEILDTLDESIRSTEHLIAKYSHVRDGLLNDLMERASTSPLSKVELLDNVTRRGSGHTPSKENPAYWNGGVKWVSLADSGRLDKLYIGDTDKEISRLGIDNSSAVLHPAGTVILTRDAGVGKSAILASPMAVSQHLMAWQCGPRIYNIYFYYWLQHQKSNFEAIAMGSTIKTIGLSYFKSSYSAGGRL